LQNSFCKGGALNTKRIEELAKEHGFNDFKWIDPSQIITAHWVRAKCEFGCGSYGRKACCPPETPSVGDCRSLFDEYKTGLFYHFSKKFSDPQLRHAWSRDLNAAALSLERAVFLEGFHKAFVFAPAPCNLCSECKGRRNECTNPAKARPSLESFSADVFGTARKFGYPIGVLRDYGVEINRYGALLIE
jgi:predicted metal-binding protein